MQNTEKCAHVNITNHRFITILHGGGLGQFITILHGGGLGQFITILHGGGGSAETPKLYYVIYEQPLMLTLMIMTSFDIIEEYDFIMTR